MKRVLLAALSISALTLVSGWLQAQVMAPDASENLYKYQESSAGIKMDSKKDETAARHHHNPPPPPPGCDPKTVPFDGGLSFLVVAGAGIAAKKKYDDRKKKDTSA